MSTEGPKYELNGMSIEPFKEKNVTIIGTMYKG